MGSYKLSQDAKSDLKRIYRRGVLEFGEERADKYFDAFFIRFEEIAENPFQYQLVEHIKEGYRRSPCGSDNIYYLINGDITEIMNIIGKQDVEEHLKKNLYHTN
ncbi:MAG: toxin ParE1/3/4 [Candidatus Endobugula sp.]